MKRIRLGEYVIIIGRRSAYVYKITREGQKYVGPVGFVRGKAVVLIGHKAVKLRSDGELVEAV
ncbi:MAG: hypothetical protein ACP5I3_09955 [Thermoproteus sp.]